ncbi:hypothetical protein GWP85_10990 [Acinetobacter beijerinckii]|uniref:hypothetical protein n=1 Tax=Acinetobacter beijerinckii TaxID=262668 RepID=UPI0023DDD6A4|nr:hypothetical protein [Acinetobacter beijerinckii]MDF2418028.1 hypothetical protein [Acinetobacter beijerinckii]
MDTFMLCPLQSGYGFTPGNNLREQAIEGGMPRQVPFFVGAVHTVNVAVFLKDDRYRQYFWAFWRSKQRKPENWMWSLSLDNGIKEQCECRFISSSLPTESYRNGRAIKVSFQVLVQPLQRDPDQDRNIINTWQAGLIGSFDSIEKIPNVWLPDALG